MNVKCGTNAIKFASILIYHIRVTVHPTLRYLLEDNVDIKQVRELFLFLS